MTAASVNHHGTTSSERRATVARYDSYAEAEEAVGRLAAAEFPIERVSIVGEGLRMVEHVQRRRGAAAEIGYGALGGAIIGAIFGWFLGLFGLADPLVNGIVLGWWGLVIGAALGAIVGALTHLLGADRRGFESISAVQADGYCVVTAPELAPRAARALGDAAPERGA